MNKPKNKNYAAIVVKIKTIVPLDNCDNVQAAIILGNQVIVSKDVKVNDIGLYFPLECALSKQYLSNNNLYRKNLNLNKDLDNKGGFFDLNGRIRCQTFRGHKSEGFFMPFHSTNFILEASHVKVVDGEPSEITLGNNIIKIGDEFDELEGVQICQKYIPKYTRTEGASNSKKNKNIKKYESKLIDNQFRFHSDTSMLYKNLHKIKPNSLISITYKMHGTSGISSYVLCKRKITKREKVGKFLHNIYTNIVTLGKSKFVLIDTEYDYIYSSRKVIKNEELNPNAQHFYNEDIWGIAHNEVKEFLKKGMTFYYEIVGFLPNGGAIQKDYNYGCEPTKHAIYIYRITSTNVDGKVIEFSAKQVQDFCDMNMLKAVPELFYGFARDLSDERMTSENWESKFLETIKERYNEKDCVMCINKVPEEGCVIRIEGNNFEAYKQKSNRFYELETKQLDKNEINIEDEN